MIVSLISAPSPPREHWLFRLLLEPDRLAEMLMQRLTEWFDAMLPWLVGMAGAVSVALTALVIGRALRTRAMREGARRILVLPPPEVSPGGAITLWMGLHAILRPAWKRLLQGQHHLAWEVVADPDALQISLWVPRAVPPGLVERAVESAWPGARTEPHPESSALIPGDGHTAATDLVLAQPEWFPIGDAPDTEPLRLALGTMTALEPGERAVVQVLARPATSAQRLRLRRAARRLRRDGTSPATATPFWSLGPRGRVTRPSGHTVDPTIDPDVRAILTKASSPLWQCLVRVAVTSTSRARARGKIHALAGAFAVFEGRNGFRRRRILAGRARIERRSLGRGYLLSATELSQVAALPGDAVPGLECARARTVAPPRALPRAGRVLGISDHPGVSRPVAIAPEHARHHLHIVGETGTGKSTLMARMILDDAAKGRSAAVIDPKGDLVESVLERLPDDALERTCLLEPDDPGYAVGLNVLEGPPDLVIDHIVGAFRRIFEPHWGPRTDFIMRSVCMSLTHIKGATLVEAPELLMKKDWWQQVGKRLSDVTGLGSFWDWYERMSDGQRNDAISSLMNKLSPFQQRGSLRAIVGQPDPKLDIETHLSSGGLLLVRIPKGTLGDDTSQLIGTFAVARVWQAAMKRASLPEASRKDTTLYVDEMHNYLALPRSFEDLLAEARGYRLALVLAHQHMNQLPRNMRDALAANARTKIVFTCSPEDANQLERHFSPYLGAHDLHNLAAFQVACRPCIDSGHGQPFTFATEKLGPPRRAADKVRAVSRAGFARRRQEVEDDIARRHVNARRVLLPKSKKEKEEERLSRSPSEDRTPSQSVSRPVSQSMSQSLSRRERPTREEAKEQVEGAAGWAGG